MKTRSDMPLETGSQFQSETGSQSQPEAKRAKAKKPAHSLDHRPKLETIDLPLLTTSRVGSVAEILPIKKSAETKDGVIDQWIEDADSHGNFIDEALKEVKEFEAKHAETKSDKLEEIGIETKISAGTKLPAETKDTKPKRKHPWIFLPNANTPQDLLIAINGKIPRESNKRTASLGLKTVVTLGLWHAFNTKLLESGALYTTKHLNGKQEIRFATDNPNFRSLDAFGHRWDKEFQLSVLDDKVAKNRIIESGNITIVSIPPGHIGIAKMNGNPVVLLPGQHAHNTPAFRMSKGRDDKVDILDVQKDLSSIENEFNALTIARILPKEIGIADDNGKAKLLLPGTFIRNSTTFKLVTKLDALTLQPIQSAKVSDAKESKRATDDRVYSYKTLTIINVGFNEYACIQTKEGGKFLSQGTHTFNDSNVRFEKMIKLTDPNFEFAGVQRVSIKGDELGLFTERATGNSIVQGGGLYTFDAYKYQFHGTRKLREDKIEHGNYTRCVVKAGQIGVAWRGQNVLFLNPGVYEEYDPTFKFHNVYDATQLIQVGDKAHIPVKSGEARPVYRNGKLQILTETTNFENETNLTVCDFVIPLNQTSTFDPPKLEVQARDNMWYMVSPQIVYKITDAEKLMQALGAAAKKPNEHIQQRLKAIILQHFMRYNSSRINPTQHAQALGEKESKEKDHSIFNSERPKEGSEHWTLEGEITDAIRKELDAAGFEVQNFEFLEFCPKDLKTKEDAEQTTVRIRQAERQLEMTTAEAAVHLAEAQAKATRAQLEAKSAAETKKIEAQLNAETDAIKSQKAAEAESARVAMATERENAKRVADAKAETEIAKLKAEAIRAAYQVGIDKRNAEAKADADAIKWKLMAEADGQRALAEAKSALLETPGYVQLELAKLQLEIARQQASMQAPLISIGGGAGSHELAPGQKGFLDTVLQPGGVVSTMMKPGGIVPTMMKQRGPFRSPVRRSSDPAVLSEVSVVATDKTVKEVKEDKQVVDKSAMPTLSRA